MSDLSLQDQMLQIKKKADDTYAMLSNVYLEIEKLKKEHQETSKCSKKSVKQEDFDDHSVQLKSHLEGLNKQIHSLCDHKDAFKAFLRILKEEMDAHKASILESSKKVDSVIPCVEELKSSIKTARTDLDLNMNDTVSRAKKELGDRIDACSLKQDCLTLKQIEEYFNNRLQSASLDASNAYIKCTNQESRIVVLEKQLENILLRLTSQENKAEA